MKSITVSVDDETYHRSCIKAAERGTSVSGLVREYLNELIDDNGSDAEIERLRHLQDDTLAAIEARGGGLRSLDNFPRNELHEPDAISWYQHSDLCTHVLPFRLLRPLSNAWKADLLSSVS